MAKVVEELSKEPMTMEYCDDSAAASYLMNAFATANVRPMDISPLPSWCMLCKKHIDRDVHVCSECFQLYGAKSIQDIAEVQRTVRDAIDIGNMYPLDETIRPEGKCPLCPERTDGSCLVCHACFERIQMIHSH